MYKTTKHGVAATPCIMIMTRGGAISNVETLALTLRLARVPPQTSSYGRRDVTLRGSLGGTRGAGRGRQGFVGQMAM